MNRFIFIGHYIINSKLTKELQLEIDFSFATNFNVMKNNSINRLQRSVNTFLYNYSSIYSSINISIYTITIFKFMSITHPVIAQINSSENSNQNFGEKCGNVNKIKCK